MRRLMMCSIAVGCLAMPLCAADGVKDTPKAAAARKKLKQKISVDFQETRLAEAVDEIKQLVEGLGIRLDTKGGVSQNQPVTFKADDTPLEDVLDMMLKKLGLGYIVVSKEQDAYDGTLLIRKGNERGFPKKES